MTPQDNPPSREYDGPERRKVRQEVIDEVARMIALQFAQHEARERAGWEKYINELKEEAFPDGAAAHREAHQAMIDAANTEAEFWRDLKLEIAKKSIWGILQVLAILVAAGLMAKFGLTSLFGMPVGK